MLRRLLFGALLLGSTAVSMAAQPVPVQATGTLHMVWGDPMDDRIPRYQALIDEGNGRITRYAIDHLDLGFVARLQQLDRQRVVVTTEIPRAGLLAEGSTGSLPRLREVSPVAAASSAARLMAPAAWVIQRRPYAVVLCKFNDIPTEPLPPAAYERMYGRGSGGADAYYREVSRERLNLEGTTIVGWVTLPRPRSGYTLSDGEANLGLMSNDCLAAADSQLDYSQFGGVGMHFNSAIGCCSWGGSTAVLLDGPARVMPAMWNMDWARSGTVWHELGHSFGLPHSAGPYGAVYDSRWDVMSSSSTGSFLNADFGRAGAHFLGYHKDRLGLIPDSSKVEVMSGTWHGLLESHSVAATTAGSKQLIVVPLTHYRAGAHLMIEARTRAGLDRSVPGEGVLITTVDISRGEPAQVVDVDGNGDVNDAGAVFTVGETYDHPGAAVRVRVDSTHEKGWWVTVTRNAGTGVATFAKPGATLEVPAGVTGWIRDSAAVTAQDTWFAYPLTLPQWLRLERSSGTRNGWLVYTVNPSLLSADRSVFTLQLWAPVGQTRSAFRLEIGRVADGRPQPLAQLSRVSRSIVASRGEPFVGFDTVRLNLSGALASVVWSARPSPRMYLYNEPRTARDTLSFRTGSNTLAYWFVTAGLNDGTYIDTLRIDIPGHTPRELLVIDTVTLNSNEGPAIQFSPRRPSLTMPVGALPQTDSVQVVLSGTNAEWSVFNRRSDSRLVRTNGASGEWIVWQRSPLAVGRTIDTIFVNVPGISQQRIVDTLTGVNQPLTLTASRRGMRGVAMLGSMPRIDSVQVAVLSTVGVNTNWTASAPASVRLHQRDAFTTVATGRTGDFVRWSRNLRLLDPGRYIDTISIVVPGAIGSPFFVVDTTDVQAPLPVMGDADGDGSITAADASTILRWLVQMPVSPRANVRVLGDANCDGQITIADALIILQHDAGQRVQTSCIGRPVSQP
ncbi:MAG: hypothetical protein IBJ03_18765 [Gemmatimonadaceae bacterium]|nr:hypothetical protein [Gemmatimonadaceae bacterium]